MPGKQLPVVRIVVEFDPFTADAIKSSAAKRGQSVAVWLRRAVQRQLADQARRKDAQTAN